MQQSGNKIEKVMVKRLGSLWTIQCYLKRLGVQEIIDAACSVESHARLTHGQVIEVLSAIA